MSTASALGFYLQTAVNTLLPRPYRPFFSTWKMASDNTFPAGTRVFYWNNAGQSVYGTVQRAARGADGELVVEIKVDATGSIITIPARAVTRA
ncbi:hypothetical protein B0H11DRAFT_1989605 [Mycena galericulata]|nr:hypothetical protein B0H11DRAFT_1989605 [Mycena galericulata]